MANNKQIAQDVLAAVGGKANITSVSHCMTRLRFNLKDESMAPDAEIKKIAGVAGVMHSGGQTQVIIGQNVDKVYTELTALAGIAGDGPVEDAVAEKQPWTLKRVGGAIMDTLSGSLVPAIPVLLAASIFKMLVSVLGPDMLNVLPGDSDLMTLFTFVGDAGFYFFPLLVGYTCAKKVGATPVMGIFLGGILIHPTLIAMANEGAPFTVYGIPVAVQNYSSTILPIILSVCVMAQVEKFLKKIIPDALKVMFVPVLTTFIMLPLALCVLGPAGGFLGNYICGAIIAFGNVAGFIGIAVVAATWEFLVMTGMHHVMISQMIMVFAQTGYDPVISVGATLAGFGVVGMCLGMFFVVKDNEQKGLSLSYSIATLIGGVTEPGLYGVGMRWMKPFLGMAIGGFIGGLYAGIMGVACYAMVPVASVIALTAFLGSTTANFVHGCIAAVIVVVASAIATFLLCRNMDTEK